MTENTPESSAPQNSSFEQQAEQTSPGIVAEFLEFLVENKKWWLIPILIAVGMITLLVAISSSPLSPFIYPLF